MKTSSLAILITLFFSGCIQQIALNSIGGIMDTGFEVINEEQDLDIADKSIASNLKLLETVIRKDPDNKEYLLLASRGYSSYALGFAEDAEDNSLDRARELYLRGKDYGLRILNRNEKFRNALGKSPEELRTALASFSTDDVPAIFWTAIGWGSYVNVSLTDPSALADLPKIETMMRFVLDKDPTYFYGGPHFFLGTLYGARPKMFGGDSDSSRKHFEECFRISDGKFLMAYIFYAKTYAVQTQDRELFESCLTRVDTTSLDVLPKARLSNAIAKKKARLLRQQIDQLF
ncbi:MAG: hypothetical protein HY033_07340 [Ignavibacteriae bacterium]|nr:hypothetical protein [Ignavibacteria bacterium]MBI3364706.1 hypothetical protein [Ignavibacteriota bacterium]